jgi:hypothetical protein
VNWDGRSNTAALLKPYGVQDTTPQPLAPGRTVHLYTQKRCRQCDGTGQTVELLPEQEALVPETLPCPNCVMGSTPIYRGTAEITHITSHWGTPRMVHLENIRKEQSAQ